MAGEPLEILSNCRYYLELHVDGSDDRVDGYFMDCQGFKRSQEVVEHCEVTPQKWGKQGNSRGRVIRAKVPGNFKCDNIVLKRGLTTSDVIWKWFKAVETGDWAKQRRDGDLTLYDQSTEEAVRFRFLGGWPTSYKIADVKAGSSEFEIEEVELAVDEFFRVTS
jgi:phage tail-like protein